MMKSMSMLIGMERVCANLQEALMSTEDVVKKVLNTTEKAIKQAVFIGRKKLTSFMANQIRTQKGLRLRRLNHIAIEYLEVEEEIERLRKASQRYEEFTVRNFNK